MSKPSIAFMIPTHATCTRSSSGSPRPAYRPASARASGSISSASWSRARMSPCSWIRRRRSCSRCARAAPATVSSSILPSIPARLLARAASGQLPAHHALEPRGPGAGLDDLVERHPRARAVELDRRHLVVEPRPLLDRPRDRLLRYPGGPGEPLPDALRGPRHRGADAAALMAVERVAQRRAHRLVHGRPRAVRRRELGPREIGVVHVAGEEHDARRRRAVPAGRDAIEQVLEVAQRLSERRPVLEVERLAHLLAEARRDTTPRTLADGLVPRLDEVHAAAEERGQRRAEQQVVERAVRPAFDALPLLFVDHVAAVRAQHAPGA